MIDYIFVFLVSAFVIIPLFGSFSGRGSGYARKDYIESLRDGWIFTILAGAGLFLFYLFVESVFRILINQGA